MCPRSLWGWDIPQGVLGPSLRAARDGGGTRKPYPRIGTIHPWPPVPSPRQSVGTWASGTYPVIRATQQAGRGLREGPVEAAAACPAQGAKARRLGCGVHCLASPLLASTGSAAAGSGLLAETPSCPPTQACPGLHVLAWASSHHGAIRCTGYRCHWPPGGTAWAPRKTLQGEAGRGGLIPGAVGGLSSPGCDRLGRGQGKVGLWAER